MKKLSIPVILVFYFILLFTGHNLAQSNNFTFEPSDEYPFGLPNPEAPGPLVDFAPLIGESVCTSVMRNQDQTWAEPVDMIWKFKYIMNGMGIQDETLKSDGTYAGSIRQYIGDSARWYVHYYSSGGPSAILPSWEGNKNEEGNIILYRKQKAPNGMDGFYKITFSDMHEDKFKWLGEWVTADESFSYPTWKIDCLKRSFSTNEQESNLIRIKIKSFSQAYINGDYDAIADAYTPDGKIFPGNTGIISGREAIKKRWTIKDGSKILHHEIFPEEIRFLGNHAYDYGYYEGKTQSEKGDISQWKGKYVIIWRKENNEWKMYLDIWNRVSN